MSGQTARLLCEPFSLGKKVPCLCVEMEVERDDCSWPHRFGSGASVEAHGVAFP